MNAARVAELLRQAGAIALELADELEGGDVVNRDLKPSNDEPKPCDPVTRRAVERALRHRGYPLPPRNR